MLHLYIHQSLVHTSGQQKHSLGYLEIRSFPKIFMITIIAKEEISYDNGDSNCRDNGDWSHDFVFALCTMFTFFIYQVFTPFIKGGFQQSLNTNRK